MTDVSERLLAERFTALASPLDDSDWLDVRRRAGFRRSRTWVALPLAAAVAAIVVGSAFALYRDSIDFWSAPSLRFPATPDALDLEGGGVVSVCCAVGDRVATVVLQYQDGARAELEPLDGFLLGLVPPEQYASGHRLERILMLDAEGREIASRTLDPTRHSVYPCAKDDEIELGHGIRVCP
jgi:hypothetical protein